MTIALQALDPQIPESIHAAFDALRVQITEQFTQAHDANGHTLHTLLSAYHNQTQSLTDATWTAIVFNSEDDLRGISTVEVPVGVHSKTLRTDRFLVTPLLAGRVRVRVRVRFDASATGDRSIRLLKNDAVAQYGPLMRAPTLEARLMSVFEITVEAGDALAIEAFQNSGGPLASGSTDRALANEIELEWL